MSHQVEVAAEINAPAPAIFAWLQPDRLNRWWDAGEGETITLADGDTLRRGSHLRLSRRGRMVELEITECSPPALLAWREPNGDGITFLVFPVDLSAGMQVIQRYTLASLWERLRERFGGRERRRARLAAALERLRVLAEEEARSAAKAQMAKYEARRAAKAAARAPIQWVAPPADGQDAGNERKAGT
jgi:uncharacterized protein YndB with AHSA1/START domain